MLLFNRNLTEKVLIAEDLGLVLLTTNASGNSIIGYGCAESWQVLNSTPRASASSGSAALWWFLTNRHQLHFYL